MASFLPPMSCRHGWKMLRLVFGPSTRIVPDESSSRRRCASSPSAVPTSAKPAANTTAARTPSVEAVLQDRQRLAHQHDGQVDGEGDVPDRRVGRRTQDLGLRRVHRHHRGAAGAEPFVHLEPLRPLLRALRVGGADHDHGARGHEGVPVDRAQGQGAPVEVHSIARHARPCPQVSRGPHDPLRTLPAPRSCDAAPGSRHSRPWCSSQSTRAVTRTLGRPVSSHVHATVGPDDLPGDKRGCVCGQVLHGVGHVLGRAGTAGRGLPGPGGKDGRTPRLVDGSDVVQAVQIVPRGGKSY